MFTINKVFKGKKFEIKFVVVRRGMHVMEREECFVDGARVAKPKFKLMLADVGQSIKDLAQ